MAGFDLRQIRTGEEAENRLVHFFGADVIAHHIWRIGMTTTSLLSLTEDRTTAKEKLARDVQAVLEDAQELLTLTAAQAGERVADVRRRLQESVTKARERVDDLGAEATEAAHSMSSAAERCVRENPLKSLGAAAAAGAVAGLLIGMLIGRR